ncbi:hypothetical protein ACIGMX_34430 [Streptomyces aquilus]|uniref:hypothetical protein n=1 Tax=Streptomyces aquilus TaxID=2548456 RepID=UPI0037D705EB
MAPSLLEQALDYAWFAERWGWPPSVVDEQPAWVMERLPTLADAFDTVHAARQERAQQAADRAAQQRG